MEDHLLSEEEETSALEDQEPPYSPKNELFAAPIMIAVGVPADISHDVAIYSRLMIVTAILLAVEIHLEYIFINLGYTPCATFNSLLTGVGVDVTCSYLFLYRWQLGIHGAALAQIVIKTCRIAVWLLFALYFGLLRTIFVPPPVAPSGPPRERLLNGAEVREFVSLALPSIASNFSGWLIFELQLMAMANIPGITAAELAAGAIWVTSESTMAAVQSGWLQVTSMRTLVLLGKRDAGAPRAFAILCTLSFLLVAVCNIPLLLCGGSVSALVSNDPAVQSAFHAMLWVLVLHCQSRICSINASSLFIPLGKWRMGVGSTFLAFYGVATPMAALLLFGPGPPTLPAMSVYHKMVVCVATTAAAQLLLAAFGFSYFAGLDWQIAGRVISDRANMDKKEAAAAAAAAAAANAGTPMASPVAGRSPASASRPVLAGVRGSSARSSHSSSRAISPMPSPPARRRAAAPSAVG